jgi:hypothetical protein
LYFKDLEKLITSEISNSSSNSLSIDTTNVINEHSSLSNQHDSSYIFSSSPHQFKNKEIKTKRVTFPSDSQIVRSSSFNNVNEYEQDNEQEQSFASITTTSSIVDNKIIKRKIIR